MLEQQLLPGIDKKKITKIEHEDGLCANATVTSRLKQINLVKVSNPFQLDVQ